MINHKKVELWEAHKKLWKLHCPLSKNSYRQVFGKGSLSAEFLFIGEAPGKLEEIEGVPFVGQSGQLLSKAISDSGIQRSIFFTNLLCCRPSEANGRNRTPTFKEIESCSERVMDLISIIQPLALVLLGKTSENFFLKYIKIKPVRRVFCLKHPSWVLRNGGVKGREFKLYVKELKEVLNVHVY